MGLPSEIHEKIVEHCCQPDLICLALVSKYCRDLASSQLYRRFSIVFPDEDDPLFDSPIDALAGGLDSFVTSDYDYAQHLRHLSLDTLSVGSKGEAAYLPYLYKTSCGKFMNTLLLLTLRKAHKLETIKYAHHPHPKTRMSMLTIVSLPVGISALSLAVPCTPCYTISRPSKTYTFACRQGHPYTKSRLRSPMPTTHRPSLISILRRQTGRMEALALICPRVAFICPPRALQVALICPRFLRSNL